MKRVFLFILTNLLVMVTIGVILSVVLPAFGVHLTPHSGDLTKLLLFSGVVGFTGAIISLLMSKRMAKWSVGAEVISVPRNSEEQWLLDTVAELAKKAGIDMPEVAIYEGDPNAFATGAFKNSALVAVSTGLLRAMSKYEVKAVLAHEVAHVANGDMVTLTLVQGVVNTFTVFLSRIIGDIVDKAILKNESGRGLGYYATVFISEILLSILASILVCWVSRIREYRADEGAVLLMGGDARPMISALQTLGKVHESALPKEVAAFGISGGSSFLALFSTHPPLESRIAALGG